MKPSGIRTTHWIKYNLYFVLEHLFGYNNFKKYFGFGQKKLYKNIDKTINHSSRNGEIVEMQELDRSDMAEGIKKLHNLLKEPVLLKGAASDWPSTKKWDLDYFADNYGDEEVFILDTVGAIDPENPQKFEKILLRDYIEQVQKGSLKYLKFSSIVDEKPELQNDLDRSWLSKFDLPFSFGKRFYSFIGGKGTVTPLHNEFPAVVYVQISGRKRWIMYTPNERVFLDPRTERRVYNYSKVNLKNVDEEQFPLIKYGKKYEVVLEPGDVLWFPPFAWHYVENLTDSIGVAYKFSNIGAAFRSSRVLTLLYFLATRPFLIINFLSLRFGTNNVDTKPAELVKNKKQCEAS